MRTQGHIDMPVKSKPAERSVMYTERELEAHQEAHRKFGQRNYGNTKAPRTPVQGMSWVVPAIERKPALFEKLAEAKATKLLKGARAMYTNGYKATFWVGLGHLANSGYDEVDLARKVGEVVNDEIFRFGYEATVSIKRHPTVSKAVLHIRIDEITR